MMSSHDQQTQFMNQKQSLKRLRDNICTAKNPLSQNMK